MIVCAACEQTITAPCEAMFPSHNMQKVVPYASSNTLDSPLSGDITSGHGQGSPVSRKQPSQQPIPSAIRPCDSPTPDQFSPISTHGGNTWEQRSSGLSGWASPPCWSPRVWGNSKSGTCGPSVGTGSLTDVSRQHHGSQENHNNSHRLCHLKNSTQVNHHYPVPPPQGKTSSGKMRNAEPTSRAQLHKPDRSSARRCNALQRMLSDVLPVGFMPCTPLIKDLPADLYGIRCTEERSSHENTTGQQQQSKGFTGTSHILQFVFCRQLVFPWCLVIGLYVGVLGAWMYRLDVNVLEYLFVIVFRCALCILCHIYHHAQQCCSKHRTAF